MTKQEDCNDGEKQGSCCNDSRKQVWAAMQELGLVWNRLLNLVRPLQMNRLRQGPDALRHNGMALFRGIYPVLAWRQNPDKPLEPVIIIASEIDILKRPQPERNLAFPEKHRDHRFALLKGKTDFIVYVR